MWQIIEIKSKQRQTSGTCSYRIQHCKVTFGQSPLNCCDKWCYFNLNFAAAAVVAAAAVRKTLLAVLLTYTYSQRPHRSVQWYPENSHWNCNYCATCNELQERNDRHKYSLFHDEQLISSGNNVHLSPSSSKYCRSLQSRDHIWLQKHNLHNWSTMPKAPNWHKFCTSARYITSITCSTVVLQCYRWQAVPMEQAKIRPSVTLYSLDWSLPNLIRLITMATPTQMPIFVKFGSVGKHIMQCN